MPLFFPLLQHLFPETCDRKCSIICQTPIISNYFCIVSIHPVLAIYILLVKVYLAITTIAQGVACHWDLGRTTGVRASVDVWIVCFLE